jgi:hypothetical protein
MWVKRLSAFFAPCFLNEPLLGKRYARNPTIRVLTRERRCLLHTDIRGSTTAARASPQARQAARGVPRRSRVPQLPADSKAVGAGLIVGAILVVVVVAYGWWTGVYERLFPARAPAAAASFRIECTDARFPVMVTTNTTMCSLILEKGRRDTRVLRLWGRQMSRGLVFFRTATTDLFAGSRTHHPSRCLASRCGFGSPMSRQLRRCALARNPSP